MRRKLSAMFSSRVVAFSTASSAASAAFPLEVPLRIHRRTTSKSFRHWRETTAKSPEKKMAGMRNLMLSTNVTTATAKNSMTICGLRHFDSSRYSP